RREVLNTATLLIPRGEEGSFEVDAEGTRVKIELVFERPTDTAPPSFHVEFDATAESIRLIFTNWNSSLGLGFTKPANLGEVNGRRLMLNIAHFAMGEIDFATVQLYLGEK